MHHSLPPLSRYPKLSGLRRRQEGLLAPIIAPKAWLYDNILLAVDRDAAAHELKRLLLNFSWKQFTIDNLESPSICQIDL